MRLARGDTLIEVILAVSIFSFVAVSALTLMNNGLSMAQRSLETTLVRQQIDSQAEMLRYLSQSEVAEHQAAWGVVKGRAVDPDNITSVLDASACPSAGDIGTGRVSVLLPDVASSSIRVDQTFSQIPDTYARVARGVSQGISIQLARVAGGDAYDAYIQACWNGPGSGKPMTTGTIVRIYEAGA